jgi:HEPN domain-containing protein
MIDVEKEVAYWRDGALKDLQFAQRLIEHKEEETLYCFFFFHLTLEKAFKAHITKRTKKLPPKIHNLPVLAEMGKVNLSEEQVDFCGKINLYNIEGRYPNVSFSAPSLQKTKETFDATKELLEWLIKQL